MMLLQIVYPDGSLVRFPAGGDLELNLIDVAVKHILAKGVGVFRGEAHVEQDIRDGLSEAIFSLKEQTRYVQP